MFWLEEAGLPITGANIARAMQLSPPTVHEMIGRLEQRRLRQPAATTSRSRFTDDGREHAQRDRPPPPADRALPHRRPRDPLGRGPRGGRAARARDVAGARGADAGRDRRRDHLPPRPPDRRGRPRAGRPARRRARSAPRSTSCASRTRPRSSCTTCKRRRPRARARRHRRESGDDEVVVASDDGAPRRSRERRRDGLGPRRPGAAAAGAAAGAARPLQRPLRPLSEALAAQTSPQICRRRR